MRVKYLGVPNEVGLLPEFYLSGEFVSACNACGMESALLLVEGLALPFPDPPNEIFREARRA